MRWLALILFTLIFTCVPVVYGIEDISSPDEVVLEAEPLRDELEKMGIDTMPSNSDVAHEKTLKEKLEDIYKLEVTDTSVNNYLLTDIVTKHFDKSIIESIHPFAGYNGQVSMNFNEKDSFQSKYGFNVMVAGVDGKFRDSKSDFRVLLSYSPLSSRNMLRSAFSDVYIGTNAIPHHRLQVGYQRPAAGVEGKISAFQIPFLYRSQISRNFGTVRKIGARIIGDYDLIDYDIGLFDSDTYMKSFFSGAEFDGWVNIKPLGKTDGKYGNLKLGSGIQSGHRDIGYTVVGAYANYEYKNFTANFEWADADGYNGYSGHVSNNKASGFYTTLAYKITPKVQILARYDEFDPNKNIKGNKMREYSVGINWFIKGQGLRLIFNYVFCQNDSAKDSHRLMIGTQILL